MSYLASQVLYVGSHLGDSQIVQIHSTAYSAVGEDTIPIPTGIQTVTARELADEDIEMDDSDSDKREGRGKIVRTKGHYLESLESYPNIAPIVDAVLADTDGSGQVRVISFARSHAVDTPNRISSPRS